MLAMVVNEDAWLFEARGARASIASMLAPTEPAAPGHAHRPLIDVS